MSFGSMDMIAGKLKEIVKSNHAATTESDDDFKLSFAFQNLDELDEKKIPKNPDRILVLDLTENNFNGSNDLRFLIDFTNLKTLILDKNCIQSNFVLPLMQNLSTLWVNHNNIENLSIFVENVSSSCPKLSYLSMINNKAAPSYFNGGSLIEHNDYRLYVISKLEKLQMLDHKVISPEERMQSISVYGSVGKPVKGRKSSSLKAKNKIQIQKRQSNAEKREVEDKASNSNENSNNDVNDIKTENKAIIKKNKKLAKNFSLMKTEGDENLLNLLPELQDLNKEEKIFSNSDQLHQLTDDKNNADHELLSKISAQFLHVDINQKTKSDLTEGELINNELEMLSIGESDNRDTFNQEFIECSLPPSPSFSLIIDLESLPNFKETVQNEIDNSEQNDLNESLKNVLSEEFPDLPSIQS